MEVCHFRFIFSSKLVYVGLVILALAITPPASAQTATEEEVRSIARLYSAAFDRDPQVNGLNFWVDSFESGRSLTDIARRFYRSPEFIERYGPLDDEEYVRQLFRNILGREGVQKGVDFWVGSLSDKSSRERVLRNFSESPENVAKTSATFAEVRFEDGLWVFIPAFTNNLVASAFQVYSPDPRIGYPMDVAITIDALEATEDVSLAFFAIDKDRQEVRQRVLSATTIDRLEAGRSTFNLTVEVPTSLEVAGPYYIGAIVDAADFIGETNEDDNDTTTEVILSPAGPPNLFIETMEPDRTALILDRSAYSYDSQADLGVVNSDAGGTISWGVRGAVSPISAEAFAVMRLDRSDTGTSYDVPLYLWNSSAQRYMNAYGIDPSQGGSSDREWLPIGEVGDLMVISGDSRPPVPVTQFDPKSAHLDFYFPGGLASQLETSLRNFYTTLSSFPTAPPPDLSASDISALRSFLQGVTPQTLSSSLCISIRPSNLAIQEELTSDNEACSSLALVLPPIFPGPPSNILPPVPPVNPQPSNPLFFDKLYTTEWGGKNFGFGLRFGASASADNRGVIVSAEGALPVKVFGIGFDYMGVAGRAQALPLSERDNPPAGQEPGFSLELTHLGLLLQTVEITSGSFGPVQLFFSKEIRGKEKTVAVGPVPVKLSAALTGNLGAEYTVAFGEAANNGLALTTAPFVNVEAGASAAVTIGIADVGVEGVITLIQEKFKSIYSATINVLDDRHDDGTSEIVIVPRLQVINELSGPSGALSVFVSVEVPTVKKCSWGLFEGLCPGLKTIKYPYTLENWTGYQKIDTLLDEQALIDVITYPDGTSAYFK